jgi:hypothetical protein
MPGLEELEIKRTILDTICQDRDKARSSRAQRNIFAWTTHRLLIDPRPLSKSIYEPAMKYLEMNIGSTERRDSKIGCAQKYVQKSSRDAAGVGCVSASSLITRIEVIEVMQSRTY